MTEDAEDATERSADEDIRRAISLRNTAMSIIKKYENQLLSAAVDDSDQEDIEGSVISPVPEFLEEEKERLREDMYTSLRHIFLDAKDSSKGFSAGFYEEAVYGLVSDRIMRNLGYYQALQRAQEAITRHNSDLGDPRALEMSLDTIQKLLSGLDEVGFIRSMGMALGVLTVDLDEVLKSVILKEFAPLRRREMSP